MVRGPALVKLGQGGVAATKARPGAKRKRGSAQHQVLFVQSREASSQISAKRSLLSVTRHHHAVASQRRLERTTPSAPFKGRTHFLDGASTPPLPGRGLLPSRALTAIRKNFSAPLRGCKVTPSV